jgi:hypothetical protein
VLTVRAAQRAALTDACAPALAEAIEVYLRLQHADALAGMDDTLVTQRVGIGLRRARGWGFDSMFGLGLFVALMFEVAPDFDTDRRIAAILADPSRPLNARLEALETALSQHDWQQLAAGARASAWTA